MSTVNIPSNVRALFKVEEEDLIMPGDRPEIVNRKTEIKRVVKRISSLIDEHQQASDSLGIQFETSDLLIVINALRGHAGGGSGALSLGGYDEITAHCLNRLFEELVEEPSNILYTTLTENGSTRYDAMDSSFWIECLNQLEKNIT